MEEIIDEDEWKQKTRALYDTSATSLTTYFAGIGSRIEDIERGLTLTGRPDKVRVVEIGCGDGRDASEIMRRVAWYEGFDPSEGMLEIARKNVPGASFVCADALSYDYPKNLDVIYSFASLLHSPKEEVAEVFQKAHHALKPGGILYISLKERPTYQKEIKKDQFGERLFYYYTPQIIKELSKKMFKSVYIDHQTIGSTAWFTLALRKKDA